MFTKFNFLIFLGFEPNYFDFYYFKKFYFKAFLLNSNLKMLSQLKNLMKLKGRRRKKRVRENKIPHINLTCESQKSGIK